MISQRKHAPRVPVGPCEPLPSQLSQTLNPGPKASSVIEITGIAARRAALYISLMKSYDTYDEVALYAPCCTTLTKPFRPSHLKAYFGVKEHIEVKDNKYTHKASPNLP